MKVYLSDLKEVYEKEIRKNVKNKQKIFKFEEYKLEYLLDIKRVLENNLYEEYYLKTRLIDMIKEI